MTEHYGGMLPGELWPILDTVLDAVIVLSKDGRVVAWNGLAEYTFGWTSSEACGRKLSDLIIPPEHRASHEEGMVRLHGGGTPRVLNRRIEMPALCKDGRQIPVELSITTGQGTDTSYFVGFLRDISERHAAEAVLRRQLREHLVMLEITQFASQANSFEEAVRAILGAVCEMTEWQAGHAFRVDRKDPGMLVASSIWYEKEPDIAAALKEATEGVVFPAGVGLPGQVLQSGGPVWMSDVNIEGTFIRKGCGFRGAFAFPLMSDGKITAVLEFFSSSPSSPDPSVLYLAQALGQQLSQVIERSEIIEQRELLINELNHRMKNLLTIVQSIASLTFGNLSDPEQRLKSFMQRLAAIARAQDLVIDDRWEDTTLRAVIAAALAGFPAYADRISLIGPEVRVPATDAQTSVLTVHELCTNALKYGALATDNGRIEITWGYKDEGPARTFFFDWRESGAKLTGEPQRKGFGSSLLRRGLGGGAASKFDVQYNPDGIHYRLTSPSPEVAAEEVAV